MRIEKTTTGLIIKEPSEIVKRKCLQYFTLPKPTREFFIYSGNDPDNKPTFGHEHDVIYITSGFLKINDPEIQKLKVDSTKKPLTPKPITLSMNREPRSDLQRDCIKMMTSSEAPKLTVELKPGTGKTFIALYSASKLGLKPLIVAPTSLLKNQWIDNIVELGISKDEIATKIWDAPDKKVCVVTISALEGAIRDDWNGLMKTMDRAAFGIKVVDEAHLHLKGILKFDALCNIEHNWYLSATLGRSDPSEDRILNRALADAKRFIGNSSYEEYQHEYIQVYLQDIHYHPSTRLCEETFKYGTKGLIRSTYYRMLLKYKGGSPYINNIITVIKRSRALCDYGKMIVIIPLLDTIKIVMNQMKRDPYFSRKTYAYVDGSLSMKERASAMEKEIILSTTMSMGTGVDVPDLAMLINFDGMKSSITLEQLVGRNRRRKDDKMCYYIDTCDYVKQAKVIVNWGRQRRILLPYFPGVKRDMKKFPDIHS